MAKYSPQDPTLEFVWSQYRAWDATSSKLKKELTRWRIAVFSLTALGAFTAILGQNAAILDWENMSKGLGWLSAAAVGIAGYASSKILTADKEKKWIQARSAAETCKSEAYKYILKVPPYSTKEDDITLFNKLENLTRTLYNIPLTTITKEEEVKDIPSSNYSFRQYLSERIHDQARNYYRIKADRYRTLVKRGNNWGIILAIAGFLLGSLSASGETNHFSAWVAFISTLSASLASFISANRYQYLAMSFQLMYNQLMILWAKGSRIAADDMETQKSFVINAEGILSRENEAWIAELSQEEKKESEAELTSVQQENPQMEPH